jgi:type I site-specific restriction endonuclease
MTKPEDKAREDIDRQLTAAGWVVQNRRETNLHAGRGIAVREQMSDSVVLTLDRDFKIYRRQGRNVIRTWMPSGL